MRMVMRVAIVAGETSGDLLGAGLMRAISARHPGTRFEGICGSEMTAAGCRSLYPMDRLSVLGLFETFGRYPELIPMRRRLARQFIADPPDVFVGIDAPDFNLNLELMLREAGIPTVHYASPTVWAWRQYRLRKIRRAVDLMLTLFPFEAEFYHAHGMAAKFVGHPLADMIPQSSDRAAAREALGFPRRIELVALLPGSRRTEVDFLADPMMGTAVWLAERRPGVEFVVPLVSDAVRARFEQARARYPGHPPMRLVAGNARAAMTAADVVLLASGTASLEAMLLKRPMVIVYRMMTLTWIIANLVVNSDYVGLPNLLAKRRLVPELLQNDAVPERMGAEVLRFLEDPALVASLEREFGKIHERLRNDADERAADAVLELLDARERAA
ncbi:MAG: lipid-A-disaccharide synthase [Gammaproteobacteria bacterium]|nr:lipid-A-disaccharide synthase [Gammaproteobacteria bacterium]